MWHVRRIQYPSYCSYNSICLFHGQGAPSDTIIGRGRKQSRPQSGSKLCAAVYAIPTEVSQLAGGGGPDK